MAKRRKGGTSRTDKRAGTIRCPKCGVKVARNELDDHDKRSHGPLSAFMSGHRRDLAILSTVVVVLAIVAAVVHFTPDTEEAPPPPLPPGWPDGYQPVHSIGDLKNDWWEDYPAINPDPGGSVSHPAWVTDALRDGPVIILDHSEGCAPCVQQTADVTAVLADYQGRITFIDLLADGSDQRAYDAFDAYDANGDPPYIPLTIIVTRLDGGDGTRIIWHSAEGATGKDWLHDYIKDAVHYYNTS